MNNLGEFNRVLIIDDNEAIHNDFKKIFAQLDDDWEMAQLEAEIYGDESADEKTRMPRIDVEFASQGRMGLDMLSENVKAGTPFLMAFVDMRMPPGWDGVETIKNLWRVDPDLQIVICTAYSDKSWAEVFGELGPTDNILLLKKPFEPFEAIQLAASLSQKRRLGDALSGTAS